MISINFVKKQQAFKKQFFYTIKFLSLFLKSIFLLNYITLYTNSINIPTHEFENFVSPCYRNKFSTSYLQSSNNNNLASSSSYSSQQRRPTMLQTSNSFANQDASQYNNRSRQSGLSSSSSSSYNDRYQQDLSSGSNYLQGQGYLDSQIGSASSSSYSNDYLGQEIPRAQTMDNFIAIVTKLEAAYPSLAKDVDRFVRALLTRFHYDNYYFDELERKHEDKLRTKHDDIVSNMFIANQQSSDTIREYTLDQNEKCSMYFMLSHFIQQKPIYSTPLSARPPMALSNERQGVRPPFLQAAGADYPSRSANVVFSGASATGGSQRYSGPSPGFGSPETASMNSFSSGVSTDTGSNTYGMNVPPAVNPYTNRQSIRPGESSSIQYSNVNRINNQPSYINANQNRFNNDYLREVSEFGVVTVGYDNSVVALNRVLYGILAASVPAQSVRQLADITFPNQDVTTTNKAGELIDPLYAATLADLWAKIADSKPDITSNLISNYGYWNDTMCPTQFILNSRTNKDIPMTVAELLGGIDGLNLGYLRRTRLSANNNRRPYKLSDLLKTYYSHEGFKPHSSDFGVCTRSNNLNSFLDQLRLTAENYLRLYKMNIPTQDSEIHSMIARADTTFRESLRRSAAEYLPKEICESSSSTTYNDNNQCEIPKSDVVIVFDTSQQADEDFMRLVATKLARRLGVSPYSSRISLLTNQQDSSGYGGSQNFNRIISNSTNTAEIGCALAYDDSRMYQGGQITDPVQLIRMFEQTLINLDSSPNPRRFQSSTQSQYNYRNSLSLTSLSEYSQSSSDYTSSLKSTDGAKAIIYFNYGSSLRPSPYFSNPQQIINYPQNTYSSNKESDRGYYLYDAKKLLHDNYVGAVIIALSTNREDVKQLVFDENRDILDIQQSSSGSGQSIDSGSTNLDLFNRADLSGPSDQTVDRLLMRLCDVPAEFKYPYCYQMQSNNFESVGYISQGKTQQWMMAPKTFHSTRNARLVFRVQGGRLRVCLGRDPRPDEGGRQPIQASFNSIQSSSSVPLIYDKDRQAANFAFSQSNNQNSQVLSGSDFNPICKEANANQELDFIIENPCYKQSVSECKPLYFSVKESSAPGESDPNHICLDAGCKRMDQVIFTLIHTGIACSSAASARLSIILLTVSIVISSLLAKVGDLEKATKHSQTFNEYRGTKVISNGLRILPKSPLLSKIPVLVLKVAATLLTSSNLMQVMAQQAGVYDYGANRYGEKRGNLTPNEVLAIILLVMTILAGFVFTVALCYYVSKQDEGKKDTSSKSRMSRISQEDY